MKVSVFYDIFTKVQNNFLFCADRLDTGLPPKYIHMCVCIYPQGVIKDEICLYIMFAYFGSHISCCAAEDSFL